MPTVTIFGPQRLKPTLIEAVRHRGIEGKIAIITAGWQERESEDRELNDHLEGRTVNLNLYSRSEEIMREDRGLADALRERQDRLQALQDFYRMRLHHAMEAARKLLRWQAADPILLAGEQEAALQAIRALDAEHLIRVRQVHTEFDGRMKIANRAGVMKHRREVKRLLRGVAAIALAGGHVAVLLNRLRLFDLQKLLGNRHLLAWAGGRSRAAATIASR